MNFQEFGGVAVLTAILASNAPANALNFQTFTDRATWVNALTATPSLENFNSFGSDTNFGGSSITAGSLTLSSNADSSSESLIDLPGYGFGATGVDGTAMVNMQGLDENESLFVQLPSTFSAFGFGYENYDDGNEAVSVFISNENVLALPASNGSKGFFGIVATDGSFNEVEFRGPAVTDASSGHF